MTCEMTTGSVAGDKGLGARGVPTRWPAAQRCGSRHIIDQDSDDNTKNNNEYQRYNDEDNHEDDELASVEMVSAVIGTEEHGVQSHSRRGVVRDLSKSVLVQG